MCVICLLGKHKCMLINIFTIKNIKQVSMKLLLLLLLTVSMCSCATVLRSKTVNKQIHISSNPENAEVFINDESIGNTPIDYTVVKRKKHSIEVKKEGFLNGYSKIDRKLNPLWTAISVVGGVFPGMGIPIAIDAKTGAFYDIKEGDIEINLFQLKKGESTNEISTKSNSTENIPTSKNNSYIQNTEIVFPAMEISTGQYKLKILPKTRARFYLQNGKKFGGLITAVYEDHFEIKKKGMFVRKGKEDVYFSSMKKARFFNPRLWYPIVTAPSIFPPIIWYFSGKVAEFDSKKCKWDIKSMRIVEGIPEIEYGKAKCNK